MRLQGVDPATRALVRSSTDVRRGGRAQTRCSSLSQKCSVDLRSDLWLTAFCVLPTIRENITCGCDGSYTFWQIVMQYNTRTLHIMLSHWVTVCTSIHVCGSHLTVLYARGSDGVQVNEFNTVFNAHLRRCVTNHVLPVAADTLEFMLTRGIPPDTSELQQLLHKLGKQNSWSRARILFKRESRSLCNKLGVFHTVYFTEMDSALSHDFTATLYVKVYDIGCITVSLFILRHESLAQALHGLFDYLNAVFTLSVSSPCLSGASSAGYYSGVVCEKDCLALPCNLTEIEMTLAFEMFIARNCTSLQNPIGSSQPLLITLKRWELRAQAVPHIL